MRTSDPAGRGTACTCRPDQYCLYTTWVDSYEWLAVSTAILDLDFHVEEPTGFAGYCAELATRLNRAGSPGSEIVEHAEGAALSSAQHERRSAP